MFKLCAFLWCDRGITVCVSAEIVCLISKLHQSGDLAEPCSADWGVEFIVWFGYKGRFFHGPDVDCFFVICVKGINKSVSEGINI